MESSPYFIAPFRRNINSCTEFKPIKVLRYVCAGTQKMRDEACGGRKAKTLKNVEFLLYNLLMTTGVFYWQRNLCFRVHIDTG